MSLPKDGPTFVIAPQMTRTFVPYKKRCGRIGVGAITVLLAVTLSGCGGDTGENASPTSVTAATHASASASTTPEHKGVATPIILEIGDRRVAGELDDSAASASLIHQLPLTLSFRDYGGQEKIAELPAPLNLDGAPQGSSAAPLTIGYYVPEQRLVLYYADVPYYTGIVPIGTFDKADAIQGQKGQFTVTLRQAG